MSTFRTATSATPAVRLRRGRPVAGFAGFAWLVATTCIAAVTMASAPAVAQMPPGANGQWATLTGLVRILHADPLPGTPEAPDQMRLQVGDQMVPVTGISETFAGTTVTATGWMRAGTMNATTVQPALATNHRTTFAGSAKPTSFSSRTVRTAYLLTRFASDAAEPFPASDARTKVFGTANSAASYYRESSDSTITITGDVLGWYTVDATKNDDGSSRCDWEAWAAQGKAAAVSAGVNMTQYQEVVVAGPFRNYCPFAGVAYVGVPGEDSYGKPRAYINGSGGLFVIAHEMGHTFGASHASTYRCTQSGVPVTLSETCTRSEYADPYSVMGSASRLHHAQQAFRIAQVINSDLPSGKVTTASGNGTYTLARRHSSNGTQLLRVPRGTTGSSFDLELRATTGSYDNFASGSNPVSGVMIRIAPTDWNDVTQSRLLDATPASESFEDSAFTKGTGLYDPASGTSIQITNVSTTSATVVVGGMTDIVAPSAPASLTGTAASTGITLRWSAATDNRAIASYQIARDGLLVGSTTSTTFTVTGAFPGSTHTYLVWARDAAGNPGPAASVNVQALADTTPPSGVGTLRVTATTPTSITVSWTRATDNSMIYGYGVQIDATPSFVDPSQCCTLTVPGLAPGSSHTISVRALDASGNVGPSSQVTAKTKTS